METKNHETAIAGKVKTINIKRTFNLPANVLWRAWTDPESFKKWWGPEGYSCPFCKIDLRVGGAMHSCMKASDGKEYWALFKFREIIPMKKLYFEDHFADKDGNIVEPSYYGMQGSWENVNITLIFEESGNKTIMTLNHENMPEHMYEDCIKGWNESLDKLEKNLR